MRHGHTILLIGIILAFAAWMGVVHGRHTTLLDLRFAVGHYQLFRLSLTLVAPPHQ